MTDNDYLAWLVLTNDRPRPKPAPTTCARCGRDNLPPVALAGDPARETEKTIAPYRAEIERLQAELATVREVYQYRCECAADEACAFARERDAARADLDATVLRLSEVSRACGVAEGKLEGLQRAIAAYAGHVAACERCRAPWDACEVAAGLWRDMTVLS